MAKKAQAGVRFFNCIWDTGSAYVTTQEHANSRRHLADKIRITKEVAYQDDGGRPWELIKIQEIETPMVEVAWLLELFTSAGKKADREAHKAQAAYILRLVEACAARVLMEDGTVIERGAK